MGIAHADIRLENMLLKRKIDATALVDFGSVFLTLPQPAKH